MKSVVVMDNAITITLRVRRTPNGRGINSCHWEGITQNQDWCQCVRGQSDLVVIGKIVRQHLASGEREVLVRVRYEAQKKKRKQS